MIDFNLIHIVPADDQDCEFSFQVKKQAQGPWIIQRWGWDEQLQRGFHRKDWDEKRPSLITYSGIPIGTVRLAEDVDSLEISQFFLLSEYQCQGIGTFIMHCFLRQAEEAGKSVRLALLTGSRVESLYARLGFKVITQDDSYTHMERQGC